MRPDLQTIVRMSVLHLQSYAVEIWSSDDVRYERERGKLAQKDVITTLFYALSQTLRYSKIKLVTSKKINFDLGTRPPVQ